MLGALAYRFRDEVPLTLWLIVTSLAIAIAATGTRYAGIAYIVLVAHLVIIIGAWNFGPLTGLTRDNDISYGTYIYGGQFSRPSSSCFQACQPKE